MDTQSVKKIQDTLVKLGYMTQDEVNTGYGIYGPKTTAAMNKYVANSGKDISIQNQNTSNGTKTDPNQPYTDEEYDASLNNHPIIKGAVAKGNTAEDLAYAASTGDFSGIVNQFGQPFSLEEQQEALRQGEEDNRLYYEALKQKETTDAELSLAKKQADYQNYLIESGNSFNKDKSTLDQTAANQGVLFSGGRAQKQRTLQKTYEQDQAYKQGVVGRDIAGIAQDYQYKYGNDAANGLSSSYNLGSNTYNPNVASGGVGSGGLSSIYNPGNYNYQGTRVTERKADANKRAGGYLWNRGNKLLATGSSNQY